MDEIEMQHQKNLQAAAEERQRRIDVLVKCNCTWPIEVYRNGSGHDRSCPAFKERV